MLKSQEKKLFIIQIWFKKYNEKLLNYYLNPEKSYKKFGFITRIDDGLGSGMILKNSKNR